MEHPHQAPGDRQAESGCKERTLRHYFWREEMAESRKFPGPPMSHSECVQEGLKLQKMWGPKGQ